MAKNKAVDMTRLGHYSFLLGLLLAVILALFPISDLWTTWILIGLGVIVGLLNVTSKETVAFLVAALVLLVSASVTALVLGTISGILTVMWANVINFVAFAAIIVAIKTVWVLAESK